MRTTLSVDEDVAVRLSEIQKREDKSFKAVINETLRRGLSIETPAEKRTSFQTPSLRLGNCRYLNIDRVAEILAVAEDEMHP